MKRTLCAAGVLALLLATVTASAQEPPAPSPARDRAAEAVADPQAELRDLHDQLVAALNRGEIEAVLALLHPEVVFTAQDGQVCRGRDAVRAYFQRMISGPDRLVERFHTQPVVEELAVLHADGRAAIAYGRSSDQVRLASGVELDLAVRWSATAVRDEGRWRIASVHTSTNLFDNAMLNRTHRVLRRVVIAAFVAGVLLGVVTLAIARRGGRDAVAEPPGGAI